MLVFGEALGSGRTRRSQTRTSQTLKSSYCDPGTFDGPPVVRTASSGTPALVALSSTSGWVPATSLLAEWYQLDLGAEELVEGLLIGGRADADQWVTQFYVFVSLNGVKEMVRRGAVRPPEARSLRGRAGGGAPPCNGVHGYLRRRTSLTAPRGLTSRRWPLTPAP